MIKKYKVKDADINIVSSIFSMSDNNIYGWFKKGYDTYLNKEKALNYLHYPAPIAETLRDSRLISNSIVESASKVDALTSSQKFPTLKKEAGK